MKPWNEQETINEATWNAGVARIAALEAALSELSGAVRDAGLAAHMAPDVVSAYSAMMLKWPRVTDAQGAAVDILHADIQG